VLRKQSSGLYLIHFHKTLPNFQKRKAPYQQSSDFYFITPHVYFYPAFAIWEADFHKIKVRELLSRSHRDLNITGDIAGLIDSFISMELGIGYRNS
jgi:hypothetical protein